MPESSAMVVERIAEFVAQPARGDFKQLALDAFAFQYERIEAYRALCDRRGATPSRVTDWRQPGFQSERYPPGPWPQTLEDSSVGFGSP